jgi:hypothetical protein
MSKEINVTEEMVRAGTKVLWNSGLIPFQHHSFSDELVVREIIEAALRRGSASEHRMPEVLGRFPETVHHKV